MSPSARAKEPMQRPKAGMPIRLEDRVRLVLAPNSGAMTHWGTNTYVLGEGHLAVIDPGPDSDAHFQSLMAATAGETITHILVTHAHADHSPLARRLSQATGASVLGFGAASDGRSDLMNQLAKDGLAGGGEGVDNDFCPDIKLQDGDTVASENWSINVLHTPGHFAGHLSFSFESKLFCGDHIMGWSSTLVSPPDGDIAAFMSTSERLRGYGASRLYPGHGAPIDAVDARFEWLIEHRKSREASILRELSGDSRSLSDITKKAYTDVPAKVLPMASRNVFAHLIDLVGRNLVIAEPKLSMKAHFRKR